MNPIRLASVFSQTLEAGVCLPLLLPVAAISIVDPAMWLHKNKYSGPINLLQFALCQRPRNAIHIQAVLFLELSNGGFGFRPFNAVNGAAVKTQVVQAPLHSGQLINRINMTESQVVLFSSVLQQKPASRGVGTDGQAVRR